MLSIWRYISLEYAKTSHEASPMIDAFGGAFLIMIDLAISSITTSVFTGCDMLRFAKPGDLRI